MAEHEPGHPVDNQTVKFVISWRVVFKQVEVYNISISRIYRPLATCWYLSGICALRSSRDTYICNPCSFHKIC